MSGDPDLPAPETGAEAPETGAEAPETGAEAPESAGFLTVVLPARASEPLCSEAVTHVQDRLPGAELVMVQSGGCFPGPLQEELQERGVRLQVAPGEGRGVALDAGAAAATREVLLFLHCDTRLPGGVAPRIRAHLRDPAVAGGWFLRWLDAGGISHRLVDLGANGFSLVSGLATGDQALFCRRSLWPRVGPLADFPLFEDMTLVRRLRRLGRVPPVWAFVGASARRFRRLGILGTVGRNLSLTWRFARGADPRELFREYYRS